MTAGAATDDILAQRADLIAKARAIVPLLQANAAEAEKARRLPEANLAAMDQAGLFRMRAPRRFGGLEVDLRTYVDVIAELGRGCGSTAWIGFISIATTWIAGLYSDEAQREVFEGNPDARFIGLLEPRATTKPVDGGWIVNGSWGFASNCLHAHWGLLAVPMMDAAGKVIEIGIALIPMRDMKIEDTWYVAGMAATGSNTVVAKDVFVPAHRMLELRRLAMEDYPRSRKDEPVYRETFVLTAILAVVPPILGIARGALDHAIATLGKGRKIHYTFYEDARKVPFVQYELAEAANLVETAFLLTQRAADVIAEAARAGTKLDFLTRARLRMEFCHSVTLCRQAMGLLLNVAGNSSFATANPMQRMWRDLEVASRHALVSPEVAREIYGRALLGIEEQMTPLVA